MKNSLSLAVVLSIMMLNVLYAGIITVDNKHPYAGDYKNLQEAHDAASNGDIIYVSPSLIPYDAISVTKQLTFYGVGFDITENIGEPMTPAASITGEMIFENGSSGSVLEGFDGSFTVIIGVNNITIKRNDLYHIRINAEGEGSSIIQNKLITSNAAHLISNFGASNIFLSNNIVVNFGTGANAGCLSFDGSGGANLLNNVFKSISGDIMRQLYNSLIINNIIISGILSQGTGNIFFNNMCNLDQLPQGNGNINNVDMTTVFVDHENYEFHLLPGSPAIGSGQNGTDMGIYGGDTPYVDCGFPGLPSILQIQAPTTGSQQSGLDISFKAKSNKE